MTLSRRDLEQGRMREIYIATVDSTRPLNDEQLAQSLTATLAKRPKGSGWWVFGYGSLLWNPVFPVAEMRVATLRGFHRRVFLWGLSFPRPPPPPPLLV